MRINILIILLISALTACKEESDLLLPPKVETIGILEVTSSTASIVGNIPDQESFLVSERGVCWSVNPSLTLSNSDKLKNGEGKGRFITKISNLNSNEIYYARAYATYSKGTVYGEVLTFKTEPNSIVYQLDGRTLKYGDPFPLIIDLNKDGLVDYTLWVEATANSTQVRLHFGINPIGANLIKCGPVLDENFLNAGFLIAENSGMFISDQLKENQFWTSDHGILVIRNDYLNGTLTYEGNWADSMQIVGIQFKENGFTFFGWLRIDFNKITETVTLIDYAYNSEAGESIKAGSEVN